MYRVVLPIEVKDVDRFMATIESVDPGFLPKMRWLLLGPYADSRLVPPGLCTPPSTSELLQIRQQLELQGFADIARGLQQLARWNYQARIERNLDHLESLAPEDWNHPAHVMDRPWELEHLLALCLRRIDQADGARRDRLQTILPKLQKAQEVEKRAANRREKLRKSSQGVN